MTPQVLTGLPQSPSPILWGTYTQRPTAHAQYLGWFYFVTSGTFQGALYVCTKEANSTYTWLSILSGAVGSPSPMTSGTYTPTLTNVTNLDSSTAYDAQYLRMGTVVTVSGKADVDPTTAGGTSTQLGISLPIASNFSANEQCGGAGPMIGVTLVDTAIIRADATNDRAAAVWFANDNGPQVMSFHFTYLIV